MTYETAGHLVSGKANYEDTVVWYKGPNLMVRGVMWVEIRYLNVANILNTMMFLTPPPSKPPST